MTSLSQLLVESSFCLIVFYTFYHLVLRKETFFQINRLYLLITPFLAIVIPLLNIELEPIAQEFQSNFDRIVFPIIEESNAVETIIWEAPKTRQLSIKDIAFWVYWLGVLLMGTQLIFGLIRLLYSIRRSKIEVKGNYKVVANSNFPASSFFSYVFWNQKEMTQEEQLVWQHELVHVKQWHSLDVLLMEVWVIIKWFNPLIYFFRKSLRITHEYIADQYVSQQIGSKYEYALYLAKVKEQHGNHPYVNNFAQLLKKRLLMLSRKPSQNWKMTKYFLSVPVFVGMMLLFSFDLVEQLPEPISQTFETAESIIDRISDKELLIIESTEEISEGIKPVIKIPFLSKQSPQLESIDKLDQKIEFDKLINFQPQKIDYSSLDKAFGEQLKVAIADTANFTMKWMDKECDCTPAQLPNYYHCENRSFSLKTFKKFAKKGGFTLLKDGVQVPYDELDVVSRRGLKIKGNPIQFEIQDVFNPKSKFWKELKRGDALKFTFRSGINDYFHFDVVINDKEESYDYSYDFYLGDLWVPLNMTNKLGVKYVTEEEFNRAIHQKGAQLKLLKDGQDLINLNKVKVQINGLGLVGDHIKDAGTNIDLQEVPSLTHASGGDRINLSIITTKQETLKSEGLNGFFNVSIIIKGKENEKEKNSPYLKWGEFISPSFSSGMVISESDIKKLAKEPIYVIDNHEYIPVKTVENVKLLDRKKIQVDSWVWALGNHDTNQVSCSFTDFSTEDHSCLEEKMSEMKEGMGLILMGLDTKKGHNFSFNVKIGSEEELHDSRFIAPFATVNKRGYHQLLIEDPLSKIGQDGINQILAYRTLEDKMPLVKIGKKIYEENDAKTEIANIDYPKIKSIEFFPKDHRFLDNLIGEDLDGKGNALLIIRLREESGPVLKFSSWIQDTVSQATKNIIGEESARKLENLGDRFLIVVDGRKRGIHKGNNLIERLKELTQEEIGSIEILKGEVASAKYGWDGKFGAIVIRTKDKN